MGGDGESAPRCAKMGWWEAVVPIIGLHSPAAGPPTSAHVTRVAANPADGLVPDSLEGVGNGQHRQHGDH